MEEEKGWNWVSDGEHLMHQHGISGSHASRYRCEDRAGEGARREDRWEDIGSRDLINAIDNPRRRIQNKYRYQSL